MDIQHIAVPEAGKDYPRNWSEFLDWFSREEACLAYLEGLRWPQGLCARPVARPVNRTARVALG
jgi:hypothetical protein